MLRLPAFAYHAPASLEEVASLLADFHASGASAKLIAGGTDLVPNMKHEITTPAHVVSLHRVGLDGVREQNGHVVVGAMTSIQTVAADPLVRARLPALAEACAQISGPQLRRMGTLGGNLCLDTRCLFINQTYFWRSALGFCLKKDGAQCHVVAGGRHCVAAASNDAALPLILYGAEVSLHSARGERTLPVSQLYVADGVRNLRLEPDEILTEVRVPTPRASVRCGFEKLRVRRSIDFSLVNLAALVERDVGGVTRLELAVGCLNARPKHITLDAGVCGKPLDQALIAEVARRAHAACRPLNSIATDPEWRRQMVAVLAKRALGRLV